jgi:hypothetical protein
MSTDGFDALSESVLGDPRAQQRLRDTLNWECFVRCAIELAAEHDIVLTQEELEHESELARRVWRERGV